jgi:hypothetical protein
VQDNKIRTLVGSLQRMGHLEALVIYNNELRDLDKNLEILKEFPYLTELGSYYSPNNKNCFRIRWPKNPTTECV